jgi:hypothetical protein
MLYHETLLIGSRTSVLLIYNFFSTNRIAVHMFKLDVDNTRLRKTNNHTMALVIDSITSLPKSTRTRLVTNCNINLIDGLIDAINGIAKGNFN